MAAMAPATRSNSLPNMLGRQGTRSNMSQDDVQFQTPNEPQKVERLQKFFRKSRTKRQRLDQEKYPIDEGTCSSAVCFSWLTPVFYKAWKGSLSKEDLFSCSPHDSAQTNCDRIEALWQKELSVHGPDNASLARIYYKFLAKPCFLSCLGTLVGLLFNFVSSGLLVQLLLNYLQQETSNLGYGLMLAGLMVLCQLVTVLLFGYSCYRNIRTGGRIRSATICMVYHKVMRLRSLKGMSIGEIVNLCANDGQRLFDMLIYLPHALAGPLLAVLALVYTVYLIGPASFLGTGVFIIFYPLQGVFSKIIAHYRQRSIVVTDHRVRLMSEIINCIKLIKMYAWEDSFASSIQDIRKKEQVYLERSGFFQILCQSITTLVPILSTVLTVSLHTLLGNSITAAQAFSYIAVLNSLRFMIIATPLAIKELTETFVAFRRVKSLLLMDELEEFKDKPADPGLAVSLREAIFAWDREEATAGPQDTLKEAVSSQDQQAEGQDKEMADERPETHPLVDQDAVLTETLFDINLDVRKGELLGICGSIGSGKSSLLQAVLSRMVHVNGHVAVDGTFAYVSQQACIMNMSLRENVLMGAEFDPKRYSKAIKACALKDDLDSLPNGDETEIGERGINISGGQKQRVSLSRALYSDRDIYLLDDPLSAVDTHVGKHIFSECIDTALRGKTVLFVTHQLQYLKRCDRIILMKEGRIVEDGTHEELMANGNEYCNLIKTFHSDDLEEDTGDTGTSDASSTTTEPTSSVGGAESNARLDLNSGETDSAERCSSEDNGEQEHMGNQKNGEGAIETQVETEINSYVDNPVNDSKKDFTVPRIIVTEGENGIPCSANYDYDDEDNIGLDQKTQQCTEGIDKDSLPCKKNEKVQKHYREDDKFLSLESSSPMSSPVFRKRLPLHADYLRALSADSGSITGVESEESIFYTGKLMEEEEMGDRGITIATIKSYVQSAGGILVIIALIVGTAISVGIPVFTNWWLSIWLNDGSGNTTVTVGNLTYISDRITDNPSLQFYQLVYGLSAVGFLTITTFRCLFSAKISLRASSSLHKKVFQKVVHSPMSFFDTTPLGRILNRFSKDIDELDISLPFVLNHFIYNSLLIFFSLITLTVVFPHLLVAFVFIFALFFFLNRFFRYGIREIKKYENLARSPWFSHIMTTVQSLPTIHAYGKQQEFVQSFHGQLDESTNMLILFYLANRWMAVRFDAITLILTGSTALLAVVTHGTIPAATAGLAIIYANQLIGISQYTMRLSTEVSARFTSVERVIYYIENLNEEAPRSIKSTKPSPSWPEEGRIIVKNLKMRYRPNLPLVLRGIGFEIRAKEKIGIVGRTGSGKSSLGVALYRLVEKAYGSILIDDIDICKIGLYDLRSKLSIIPQDPVLFIGTVRYNLDPINQFTDEEIWKALEKTYMKESISGLDQQLQAPVIENGENFSVGERQLLCMARALLRNSKILILDEATAAIDTETDSLIQQTIRQAFTDCTILTIAHRLNTILDSDRIMVLRDGKVLEFDSPSKLLANPASYFTAMMSAMGDHR